MNKHALEYAKQIMNDPTYTPEMRIAALYATIEAWATTPAGFNEKHPVEPANHYPEAVQFSLLVSMMAQLEKHMNAHVTLEAFRQTFGVPDIQALDKELLNSKG